MNRSVRRIALAIGLAFAALVAQLTYVQVVSADRFAEHPANRRLLVKEYRIDRGKIVAGDEVVAESAPTNDNLKYLRRYPQKSLFAHISGYYSIVYGRGGLERTFNDFLTGSGPGEAFENLVDDLLGRDRKGHTLILTIDPKLQRIAADMLGKQRGAVAAIDSETGEVLALHSYPAYDPNVLSSHRPDAIREAWERLNADPTKPLLSRAAQERYPPGSTFKVLVTAAALEAGIKPSATYPNPRELTLPLTNRTLKNFGRRACAGGASRISMATGLRVSCNTTFAQIGMQLGAERLAAMTEAFGFGRAPAFDLPVVASCLQSDPRGGCAEVALDKPQTAFSAIGQFGVRVTPLQMAMVAAAASNGGMLVQPHVVKRVLDFSGRTVATLAPAPAGPIFSKETADTLRRLMIEVVERGTGRNARISGVRIGGKTGTAETGVEGQSPHAWFIAFGPRIAVAVVVENGGDLGDDATGGKVAAPIARALIQARIASGS